MQVLGIDVGGSAIKGAVVDTATGYPVAEPIEVETPQPALPQTMIAAIAELVRSFRWRGPLGCGFPAVIDKGVVRTAANIDDDWVGIDLRDRLYGATGCACHVINDADAAGLAEMTFGAGRGRAGTVLVLTLGTGIGSALFYDGRLFPNLELGFMPFKGGPAEHYAAAAVRTRMKLSWSRWGGRLDEYLRQLERMFSPELIIIGGGVSRNHGNFFPYLQTRAELLPARLFNRAGIVGAARFAAGR